MAEFEPASHCYSNFITYPDLTDDVKHTVLLINADPDTVQQLAQWCQTADHDFNVYIHNDNMQNDDWVQAVHERADQVINQDHMQYFINYRSDAK